MAILNTLKNIGLSDNEAKVYKTMLELGPASVLEISAKAGVNRPTTYVQIESLKKEGLVSTQTKGKKQLFMAEAPEQLSVRLEKEDKLLEQKKEELEGVLPDLKALFNSAGDRPTVRYFEGKEGLLKLQEEFLKVKNKTVYSIGSIDDAVKIFPKHFSDYGARRIKNKIEAKFIYTSGKGDILPKDDRKAYRESRYIPPEKFPFKADITIFDDSVAISSLQGNIGGTIITSKEVADSFRVIFKLLWEQFS